MTAGRNRISRWFARGNHDFRGDSEGRELITVFYIPGAGVKVIKQLDGTALCKVTGPESELKKAQCVLEIGVGNKVIDGWIFGTRS